MLNLWSFRFGNKGKHDQTARTRLRTRTDSTCLTEDQICIRLCCMGKKAQVRTVYYSTTFSNRTLLHRQTAGGKGRTTWRKIYSTTFIKFQPHHLHLDRIWHKIPLWCTQMGLNPWKMKFNHRYPGYWPPKCKNEIRGVQPHMLRKEKIISHPTEGCAKIKSRGSRNKIKKVPSQHPKCSRNKTKRFQVSICVFVKSSEISTKSIKYWIQTYPNQVFIYVFQAL